jgi:hypothetical protein
MGFYLWWIKKTWFWWLFLIWIISEILFAILGSTINSWFLVYPVGTILHKLIIYISEINVPILILGTFIIVMILAYVVIWVYIELYIPFKDGLKIYFRKQKDEYKKLVKG